MFAELAILNILQQAGWEGVWVDSYGRRFRKDWPNSHCDLPLHARTLYDRISVANGGKRGGWFDVFGWKHRNYVFIESKRRVRDSIRKPQRLWIEAALDCGVGDASLLIFEWEFGEPGRSG